jgi:beta-mannan synthase
VSACVRACERACACAPTCVRASARFEVQVLDDSTNAETRAVADKAIEYWRGQGIVINAVRRTNRQGFKAGAMHEVPLASPC